MMVIRSSFRLLPVVSVLVGVLSWGMPLLAQQNLNEQFLSVVEAGEWQQAVDLIDQIVQADPGREESLAPFREKYTRRLEIDRQLSQGNWQQASALMEQFVTDYKEDASALQSYKADLAGLADLQTTVQEGKYISALEKTEKLQESSPRFASLMEGYRDQILATIPRQGQPVTTPTYTLAVSQFQDVSRQATGAQDESPRFLVGMTVQNTSAEAIQFTTQQFGLLDRSSDTKYGVGTDVVAALPDDGRFQSIGTSIPPGGSLQTGLVFSIPETPETLFFQFAEGRVVRLK